MEGRRATVVRLVRQPQPDMAVPDLPVSGQRETEGGGNFGCRGMRGLVPFVLAG